MIGPKILQKNGAVVICGFSGIGKSKLVELSKNTNIKLLDSDSSKFDKKDFPKNYIEYIKEQLEKGNSILASSHKEVRDALIKEKIPFTLVYPKVSLKEEYLKRYEKRGSPASFIKLLDENFEKWIKECSDIDNNLVNKIELNKGEFLSDNGKVKELIEK